ncbi:MAG: 7-carboxy-7-deazaguanine synthase [Gammaproteobacteria bacterium]|nr:7-carboxy-7-deazaguanine synthase [Gammaproteobacteria bacterium]MDE0367362.1 7-carboxy-7-deazaguanine synthase [Gammaproteobacteria bacterium]
MTYSVKEIYSTLQGEGAQSGRAAVFCRFSGCNLWSGLERDRTSAVCRFCDTDFVGTDGPGGGKFADAGSLAGRIVDCWERRASDRGHRFVVFTGGEPALQLDEVLIAALHSHAFEVAMETNGTLAIPEAIDWVCVSPKAGTELKVVKGNELKVVFPQPSIDYEALSALDFQHHFIQPMDGPRLRENTAEAISYCQGHPQWRLSIQSHKYLGIA